MTGLPEGWRALSLSEVARGGLFGDGDWVETKDQDPEGSVRLTQLADVGVGEFRDRSSRWLREDQAADLHCTFLQPSDVLIARMPEPIGRACLVPDTIGRAVTAVDVAILRVVDREIEPRYVMWALNNPKFHAVVESLQSGTTRKRISRKNLSTLAIPIPDPREQRRIVDILEDHLSRLDAAIGGLHLALTRSAVLERAIIDDVFMRRADAENWRVVRLEELAATERRSMTDGPFGSNLTSAHYAVSGARVVRLQNIGDGEYRAADAFISLDHYDTLRSHDVRVGDVVVASLGDLLPRAAVVPDLGGPAIVKADCIRIRPQAGLNPAWIALACRSSRAKWWAEERVHGVGRQRLGMKGIRDIPVPFPSDTTTRDEAIAAIESDFEGLRRLRAAINSAQSRGEALRKSLLAAAFSGRLTGRSVDREMVEEMAGV